MMIAAMVVALIILAVLVAALATAYANHGARLVDEERKCARMGQRADALDESLSKAHERIRELSETVATMEGIARDKAKECVKLKAALAKARRKKVSK